MWSEDKIEDYLKSRLKESRFLHSLGVKDTAIRLAKLYNEDVDKAKIAGLVHDCAKNMKKNELINIVKKYGYTIDEVSAENTELLHGLAGAIICREVIEIKGEDIFNAIAYHTTGRENMSVLEKIIYLADYIEPLRSYPGVEELRELAFKDLDKAVLKSFDTTIKYLIDRNFLIHLNTIKARNFLIKIVGE